MAAGEPPIGMSSTAMLATLFLLVVFSFFVVTAGARGLGAADLRMELHLVLTGITAALTFMLGGLIAGLAPRDGLLSGSALGLGTILLAAVTLGVGELAPAIIVEDPGLAGARGWSLLAVFGLFTVGLYKAGPTSRLTSIPCVAAMTAAAAVVVSLLGADLPWAFPLAWGIMVLAQGAAYVSTLEPRHAWIAVALLGFLLGEVGLEGALAGEGLWVIGVPTVRIIGVLFAVTGLLAEVRSNTHTRNRQLSDSRDRIASLQEATLAARRSLEERDHEARSALAAIEFTAHTLRRSAQSPDEATLHQLELALTSELALLRRLVTLPETATSTQDYSFVQAIRGVVAFERGQGMTIDIDAPADTTAAGSPEVAAEISQALLENARRHAPGSPVVIRVLHRGDHLMIIFDDSGPGIASESRSAIFRRGRDAGHPTSARGRGLGLYIARQLANEQLGHLWADTNDAGGASFRLLLPAGDSANLEQQEPPVPAFFTDAVD